MKRKRKVKPNHHKLYGATPLLTVKPTPSNEARARVMRVAKRRGFVTDKQARVIGGWRQPAYHLKAMERAKLLKRVWVPY